MAKDESIKPQPSRVGKVNTWRDLRVLAAKTDSTIDALIRRGISLVLAEQDKR